MCFSDKKRRLAHHRLSVPHKKKTVEEMLIRRYGLLTLSNLPFLNINERYFFFCSFLEMFSYKRQNLCFEKGEKLVSSNHRVSSNQIRFIRQYITQRLYACRTLLIGNRKLCSDPRKWKIIRSQANSSLSYQQNSSRV